MSTVLVVDDSAFMRLYIKKVLTGNGFNVVGEAENGLKGVEKYKELKPDIVTMDTNMDIMNGLESLKEILTCDKKAQVMMISAMGQEPIIREAMTLGAKGFIVKPFDEKQLVKYILRIVST